MNIEDIKNALVEVKRICISNKCCRDCPFSKQYMQKNMTYSFCPLSDISDGYPSDWEIDDWEEHESRECRYVRYSYETKTLRCLGTKEQDMCEGRKCKRWEQRRE